MLFLWNKNKFKAGTWFKRSVHLFSDLRKKDPNQNRHDGHYRTKNSLSHSYLHMQFIRNVLDEFWMPMHCTCCANFLSVFFTRFIHLHAFTINSILFQQDCFETLGFWSCSILCMKVASFCTHISCTFIIQIRVHTNLSLSRSKHCHH